MMVKNYGIHSDYKINNQEKYLDTRNRQSRSQNEVYQFAHVITKYFNSIKKVTDVGCGCGTKLLNYFNGFITIGYDVYNNIQWLKSVYPNRDWRVSDFGIVPEQTDLVISADVIEHVMDPDAFMRWIMQMNFKYIVISTPDRDKLISKLRRDELGPPVNKHHIREWSYREFHNFIKQYIDITVQKPIGLYGQLVFGRKRTS
ncbi:MAG: class I SAM-dependent methyltransferase [bacterium]